MTDKGWLCPKCGSVWNPTISGCNICNAKARIAAATPRGPVVMVSPARVSIWINRSHFQVETEPMSGADLRELPTPRLADDVDLYEMVQGFDDRLVNPEDMIQPTDGLRFFTVPRMITAGRIQMTMSDELGSIIDAIVTERERQDEKYQPSTCRDPSVPNIEKVSPLAEEVGEVARAANREHFGAHPEQGHDLRSELVQVAALAVGWLEALASSPSPAGRPA